MTFPKQKHLALFHRHNEQAIILITSCGCLMKVRPWRGFLIWPCYSPPSRDFVEGTDRWAQYSSPEGALRAMRRYEKGFDLPKAELLGFI